MVTVVLSDSDLRCVSLSLYCVKTKGVFCCHCHVVSLRLEVCFIVTVLCQDYRSVLLSCCQTQTGGLFHCHCIVSRLKECFVVTVVLSVSDSSCVSSSLYCVKTEGVFCCYCRVVRLEESKKRNLKLQEELRESRHESETVKQRYEEEVASQSHTSPRRGGRPGERSVPADHVIGFCYTSQWTREPG